MHAATGAARRIATSASSPAHLLSLASLSTPQLHRLILRAANLKHLARYQSVPAHPRMPLRGQTIALIFSKRSTRTRIAAESAITYLGGHPMFLGREDIQLGVNESLQDTARVVSSMVGGIVARVGKHSEIEELAEHSSVPVLNALSARYHPTQIVADLLTMHELAVDQYYHLHATSSAKFRATGAYAAHQHHPGNTLPGLKLAWVGDGNNILQELMVTLPKVGVNLSWAVPEGYEPEADVVDLGSDFARESGAGYGRAMTGPVEAVKDADYIVTDTWISMGQETEKAERLRAFSGYQVTAGLAESGAAKPTWKFMHCLPRKQEEVVDEVFYGPRSVVWQEAENRKWSMLAILEAMLVDGEFCKDLNTVD